MPTGRRGQILALALAFAVLTALYLLVAAPLIGLFAARQGMIETDLMLLPRLQAAAAELPALRARITGLRPERQTRELTLDGATDALASANLESRLDTFARSVGATIASSEILPTASRGPYRRIGLRLILTGTYETLVKLLATLETAQPPLIVDNLQLHGLLPQPGLRVAATINAGIDVYGFRTAAPRTAGHE